MTRKQTIALQIARGGAAILLATTLSTTAAAASVAAGDPLADRISTSAESRVSLSELIQRAQLWLTTGIVLPGDLKSQSLHDQSGGANSPDEPDVFTGIRGYDWDQAGDDPQ